MPAATSLLAQSNNTTLSSQTGSASTEYRVIYWR